MPPDRKSKATSVTKSALKELDLKFNFADISVTNVTLARHDGVSVTPAVEKTKEEKMKEIREEAEKYSQYTIYAENLASAIAYHDTNLLDELLDYPPDFSYGIEWEDELSYAALLAVNSRLPDMLLTLLRRGANPHLYDDKYPLLFMALDIKEHESFNILLKHYSKSKKQVEKLKAANGNLLHAAVRSGHAENVHKICELFKKFDISLNSKSRSEGVTALHEAIRCIPVTGSLEAGREAKKKYPTFLDFHAFRYKDHSEQDEAKLLKKKNDKHIGKLLSESTKEFRKLAKLYEPYKHTSHRTGLFTSSKVDLSVLQCLLQAGLDVNVIDHHGSTALHMAATLGYLDVCELLLQFKAKSLIANEKGNIPWTCAVDNGHVEIMKLLTAEISDINNNVLNLLHIACKRGSLVTVKFLVEKGASATLTNSNNFTPLMVAIDNQKTDCALYLIRNTDCGVNTIVKPPGVSTTSALYLALKKCMNPILYPYTEKAAVADAILQAGGDVNLRYSEGYTAALRLFQKQSRGQSGWEWLVQNGADLNAIAENGENLLYLDVIQNTPGKISNRILENNVDIPKLSNIPVHTDFDTVLMIAISMEFFAVANTLIDAGAIIPQDKLAEYLNKGILPEQEPEFKLIISRLHDLSKVVPTLQNICRISVLRTLGFGDVRPKINQLGLPCVIRDTLYWPNYLGFI